MGRHNNKTSLTQESLHAGLAELSKHIQDCNNLVVIGSGAIAELVKHSNDKAAKYAFTEDIDVCLNRAKKFPEKGEDLFKATSDFHKKSGYYIQLLDNFFSSNLERDWKKRAEKFKSENGKVFHILSPLDVASNKMLAGRSKDFNTVSSMIKDGFIEREKLRELHTNLIEQKPNIAPLVKLASDALDLRLERSKKEFTEKFANFAEKHRDGAKTFDFALGILGIALAGDNPTPPAMKAAEKHFDEKRISGRELLNKLAKFAPSSTRRSLEKESSARKK